MLVQTERCYVRVIDGGDGTKYPVVILCHSRLAFLQLVPERCGLIDPNQIEVAYDDGDQEEGLEPDSVPLVQGEVVIVHLSLRGDHVVRWSKLQKEARAAA